MLRYFSHMPHILVGLAVSALLTGCVQARLNAYYNPKPPEPCQVPIIVDGVVKACVSKARARKILEDLTK